MRHPVDKESQCDVFKKLPISIPSFSYPVIYGFHISLLISVMLPSSPFILNFITFQWNTELEWAIFDVNVKSFCFLLHVGSY